MAKFQFNYNFPTMSLATFHVVAVRQLITILTHKNVRMEHVQKVSPGYIPIDKDEGASRLTDQRS